MRKLLIRKRFDRDIRLSEKRGKKIEKLHKVVNHLQLDTALPVKHRPHLLGGDWAGCWECHIEPDWLLIYQLTDCELVLIRTGTHSDLFG